jgi:hypothetical protein
VKQVSSSLKKSTACSSERAGADWSLRWPVIYSLCEKGHDFLVHSVLGHTIQFTRVNTDNPPVTLTLHCVMVLFAEYTCYMKMATHLRLRDCNAYFTGEVDYAARVSEMHVKLEWPHT